MANSIFGKAMYQNTRSKQMRGRVDLLSQDVAKELNTYKNFGIFHTYNDVHTETWDDKGVTNGGSKPGTPGVRSIFNKLSSVLTGTNGGFSEDMSSAMKQLVLNASPTRIDRNVPLLDTPANRAAIRARSGCTVRELVQASQKGNFGSATYSYSDFMYCKHLGKVPNNYLITVRRYPIPILDSVQPRGVGYVRKKAGENGSYNNAPIPIGTMVTWFGVSGNNMKDILKYKYHMAWKEYEAEWHDIERQGGNEGILNGLEAMFNPASRQAWSGGNSIPALDGLMGKYFQAGNSPYPNPYDAGQQQRDKNKVYGPIDRVKKAFGRGTEGLTWDHEFSLVFEYELKAYNGINPRQAMLDLLASILSVTYTTGGFWAGGYKGGGARQASAFTNMNIFKCHGSFTDFMDALGKDIHNGTEAWAKSISGGNLLQTAANIMNMVGGMLVGGLLNRLGRPARYFAPSLISDAPVGLWHITMGNPHHPIMVMGNMILEDTEIEHSGPLGIDDFPTNLKVTMRFKRGKPRDQYGIEYLYMGGEDRIYTSMDKKLADMYTAAQKYKKEKGDLKMTDVIRAEQNVNSEYTNNQATTGSHLNIELDQTRFNADGNTTSTIESFTGQKGTTGANFDGDADLKKTQQAAARTVTSTMDEHKELNDMWLYYFGMSDGQSAIISAMESDKGAFDPAKPEEKPADNQSAEDKNTTDPGQ